MAMNSIMDHPLFSPLFENARIFTGILAGLVGVVVILWRLFFTNNSKEQQQSSTTVDDKKKKKREIFACPFSKEITFVQETAEHLAPSPMDLYGNWKDHLATRWLVAGISGQDVPGMLRAGLRKLRNSQHFLIEDNHFQRQVQLKNQNLNDPQRHPTVFVMEADSIEAQQETLQLLMAYLPQRYPELYTYNADLHTLTVHPIQTTFNLHDRQWQERPLELCERIIQEDLVLMRPGPSQDDNTSNNNKKKKVLDKEGYYMAAAAVQFSFDTVPQKLGQPVEFIHAPVPGYEQHLRKAMNVMFSQLKPQQPPMWRTTWDIHPTGTLDQVKDKYQRDEYTTIEQVQSQLYLKVEYQTIRRLPRTGYLLFTIKTMMDPLSSLEQVSPKAASCLAASIRGRSQAMQQYKGLPNQVTTQTVLKYLDGIAAKNTENEGEEE